MLYLEKFRLPSPMQEELFLNDIRRTCYNGAYPFGTFMEKQMPEFTFAPITIFSGGNGQRHHFFGGGLPHAAGNAHHGNGEQTAVISPQGF